MIAEFNLNTVEDSKWLELKQNMKKKFGITLDDMLVVEGCVNDDKTILGGKSAFFSHFCTFFSFNACYSQMESKAVKNFNKQLNSGEELDKGIDAWLTKMD